MNAELQALIDQINSLVNELAALEREFFYAVAAQPGYHQVRFSSGDTWSGGLLRHPNQSVIDGELAKHVHTIVSAV